MMFSRVATLLFLSLLPFCSLDLGRETFGGLSLNASFLLLPVCVFCVFVRFFVNEGIPVSSDSHVRSSFRYLSLSMIWLALVSVFSFLYGFSDMYGVSAWVHGLQRSVVPVVLLVVVYIGYWSVREVGERGLYFVLRCWCVVILGYGLVQVFVIEGFFPESLYSIFSSVIEGGKKGFDAAYVVSVGRVNLTALEASEGARVLGVLVFPVLVARYLYSGRTSAILTLCLWFLYLVLLFYTYSSNGFIVSIVQISFLVLYLSRTSNRAVGYVGIFIAVIAISLFIFVGYLFKPELIDVLWYSIFEKPWSLDASASTRVRYSYIYASVLILLDYPLTGVGLGKEFFLMSEYYPLWGVTWESEQDFLEGTSLSARSTLLRLLVGGGFIFFVLIVLAFVNIFKSVYSDSTYRLPIYLAIIAIICFSAVGGGNVSIFYPWVLLGMILGYVDSGFNRD